MGGYKAKGLLQPYPPRGLFFWREKFKSLSVLPFFLPPALILQSGGGRRRRIFFPSPSSLPLPPPFSCLFFHPFHPSRLWACPNLWHSLGRREKERCSGSARVLSTLQGSLCTSYFLATCMLQYFFSLAILQNRCKFLVFFWKAEDVCSPSFSLSRRNKEIFTSFVICVRCHFFEAKNGRKKIKLPIIP